MGKKLTAFALMGFASLSIAVASSLFSTNTNGLFTSATNQASQSYVETLDKSDAPTASTTYVDTATTGGLYNKYTFTNVKAADNMLCTLNAGGTIVKEQEALGLDYVNVTFTGSLTLETSFTEQGAKTTYTLTSGQQTEICGNYVSFAASEETTIESITLVYACRVSYESQHTYVKTAETVLNGTDLDAVYKCENCDHTEARVDPEGFRTYRNGDFMVVPHASSTLSLTTVNTEIGGVVGAQKIEGANNFNNWSNKVEPSLITHNGRAYQTNISYYDIDYIMFDFYLATAGSTFRIYGPNSVTKTHTGLVINTTSLLTYGNNSDIIVYDGVEVAKTITTGKWYTISVNYSYFDRDTWNYAQTYACTEISTPNGEIYINNLRYCHTLVHELMSEEFVWGTVYDNNGNALAHTGTYTKVDTEIGGRTGVHSYKGTNTYKDQIDAKFTSSYGNYTSKGNNANGANAWYHAWSYARNQRINAVTVDVYLPTNASVRLQSRPSASHLTNIIKAGEAYGAYNNGTFNTGIQVFNGETEIQKGGIIPADTWLTLKFDISYWLTANYSGSGYCSVSLTAPTNTIYLTNANYLQADF